VPYPVPQGFVGLVTRFNMGVILAHPGGYDLNPRVIDAARANAENSDGCFTTVHSMDQALIDADAVYIMNWPGSTVSEKKFAVEDWTYTEEKIKLTRDGKAFLMNSEPAMGCKSYIIAAMMLNNRFKEPAKLLGSLKKRNIKRLLFSF
jgi:ornithine carbamoyltransferase